MPTPCLDVKYKENSGGLVTFYRFNVIVFVLYIFNSPDVREIKKNNNKKKKKIPTDRPYHF